MAKNDIKDLFAVFDHLEIGGITVCQCPVVSLAICCHAVDGKKVEATLALSACPGEIIRIIDPQITGLQCMVKIFTSAASEDIVAKALMVMLCLHKYVAINYNLAFIAP
jgi:hypothetical protein